MSASPMRGLFAALTLFVALSAQAAVDTAALLKADATNVAITSTYKSYNRVTKESLYEVKVTRVGTGSLQGPVYLVLNALGVAGITSKNATGSTQANEPYYVISGGAAAAGATFTQSVVLNNPNNARVTFNPLVYYSPTPAGPLSTAITSPSTLITVGSTPIEVRGTVANAKGPLTVTVNGAPVTLNGGAFSASVALQEGHNTIVARAVTGTEESTATISVSLDLTPPYITIETPADGTTVTTKFVAVSGLINDIVRGTVSDGQANVTVNGKAASVANRTYLAENIELVEGLNTLTIRGADQVGNTNTVTTKVTYKVPVAKHIELVAGQSQRARIRSNLAQPLRVKLLDELGAPVVDKSVVFRVTEGDGEVGVGTDDQGQAMLAKTDANGIASTTMVLGSRAGNGNNRATARSVGYEGVVEFYASADPNPGDKVSVHSGNNQRGGLKQPLPLPFVVNVTDDGSNVIAGVQIAFQVAAGGGKFANGGTTYTTTTDSDGRANASLTLGEATGLDAQRVTATLVGTSLYAGFTASALVSGDPGQTSITGVVLDNQDNPLPSVTVRVEGTTREAKSNAQGQFKITEVPVGPVHLTIDGATTTAPGEWPTLPYNLVTVAGAENPLAAPIYMVKLDVDNAVWVGKDDKVITHPEMPGFELTVAKNSVTFPNGAREGYVSVTSVNASKIPMAPPNGMQPQLIVTIQPVGARFDPPAALQLPNVDGHAPGAQVEMYSFDHDLEEFVAIGLGTVSLDGTVIKSNPGVGVVKAGWHCGSQPSGGGCAASPGECQKCDGNCNISADPTNITNTAGDCKKRSCSGQTPQEQNDDTDKPTSSCEKCSSGSPVTIGPECGASANVAVTYNPNVVTKPASMSVAATTTPDSPTYTASACIDKATNSWKLRVDSVTSTGTIEIVPTPAANTPNPVMGGNVNAGNYCSIIKDLADYTTTGIKGPNWHVTQSTIDHENYHWDTEWKGSLNTAWAKAEAKMEAHSTACASAADPATALASMKAAADAEFSAMDTEATNAFNALGDGPGDPPYVAGQVALAAMIASIKAFATAQGFAACPP
jgi:hypothetical protein